ncbi:hypothetical protein GWK47_054725 [Chionoecetes opilio]|uniref:Uncharacterized protein n=1 Tax=Chionoecetes opilio TaxID=41210 RepID=A0A8J5C734_CHIOP|nr:hypothetical protein GWK47_054725 [Chionoecetes opilio]
MGCLYRSHRCFNFIVEHPHAQITRGLPGSSDAGTFTVRYIDKTSPLVSVNEARKDCFWPEKQNDGEHSPNSTALLQHTKVQCTRLASGQPVTKSQHRHQLLKAAVGTLDAETKSWVPCLELAACGSKAVNEHCEVCLQKCCRFWRQMFIAESQLEMHELCSCKCEK